MIYLLATHPDHGKFTVDVPEFHHPRLDRGWNKISNRSKAERLLAHIRRMGTVRTCECAHPPFTRDIPVSEFTYEITEK